MIASFHLVTFSTPKIRPPGPATTCLGGLRYWRSLSVAKLPFLSIPPDASRVDLLKPNLREWGFFAVWEREADLDRFLASSPVASVWRDKASEAWHLRLKPGRFRGGWAGVQALVQENGLPTMPAALITRLDLPFGALRAMWLSAVPGIAPHVPAVTGLLVGVPIMDRPYLQPMTFTVWRCIDDAMTFAYRTSPHQEAVACLRKAREDIVSRFSCARFYPYHSDGTWKGRDPLGRDETTTHSCTESSSSRGKARSTTGLYGG